MRVRRFCGIDMRDALKKVKKELGDDAVILHTKTASTQGFMGVGRKQYVEILASEDVSVAHQSKPAVVSKTETVNPPEPGRVVPRSEHHDLARYNSDLLVLKEDMLWIKNALNDLSKRSKYCGATGVEEEFIDIYAHLIEQDISEELALGILGNLKNRISDQTTPLQAAASLKMVIAQIIGDCRPITITPGKCVKVALIGPTGVGKTTTIAKLAADLALVQGKDVGVITIDTYRIAAVEQIRTYMDIMDIPLEVVTTPQQMRESLSRMNDKEIVLIDTAGRSQNNTKQIEELKDFITAAEPDEVHLVLSASHNYKSALDAVEKFSMVDVDRILFTKLDEAVTFGVMLDSIAKASIPVSYLTTGQSVPDDIEIAEKTRISSLIVGGFAS